MSGIYGVTYRNGSEAVLADAAGGLSYWTKKYGLHAQGQKVFGHSAIGSHIRHFSQRFSHGRPVLEFHGNPAVVDVLLFNRDELLEELKLPAEEQISDEELLLGFIDRKGFEALARVNGDFTGAVYMQDTMEWVLFRDHMGVRPLFYYADADRFAFSTDQRGLAALPGADLAVNEMMLYHHFLFDNALLNTQTDFLHIHGIRPGSVTRMRMTDTGFEKTETLFWKPCRKKIRFKTDEEYRQELRRLVTDSVHRRCDAVDGQLGAELSGGLDSSIIDILIARHSRDLKCFSWSYDPGELPITNPRDERWVIEAICRQENITCRYNCLEDRRAFRAMQEHVLLPYVNTKPLGIGSNYLRSQGAKVIFTGHTGDEGVSHRARRFELFWHKEYLSYFKLYWQDLEGKPLRLIRSIRSGFKEAWSYYKQIHFKPKADFYYPDVLKRDFCERMRRDYKYRFLPFQFAPETYVDQGGSLGRFHLTAYYGSFCDVQYLFPYADYRVMDFALSIPRRLYVNRTQTRLIFRETFGDLMPRELSEVDYKFTISKLHRPNEKEPEEDFARQINRILEYLDHTQWKDILDLEAISRLKPAQPGQDSIIMTIKIAYLIRCIMIQNMQRDSKKWREYDAQDKETV